ncbi:hypothetical protein BX264_7103 [Streptomyces sp. 2333.5]|uniref:Tc toxin subunit A-related protein n=1 Tax=unclassified Streptomyces TaxID=2593676 RepID=UPI0008993FB1|nr:MULTISPECIES: hypothetical protein [unclassified Streptomyces]PJJ06564.1 hypothetical protein BX264_7103 [Streptomyces sp. 2333.5]SEE96981.1 hypothetical protein SAMN05428943_7202 [Streptomyces sp. 2314.4]SEF11122.1 hypothetical protein SAMN05428942_7203 [Streptomyces sp. 2112.2]
MPDRGRNLGFHEREDGRLGASAAREDLFDSDFTYTFENFFHPFVGELIERLNKGSVAGLLDPEYQEKLAAPKFFENFYAPAAPGLVTSFPKDIDVRPGGPYSNYNWELLFHVPLSIAVHLSNNQRFAEAQRWFHYIFDPTSTDTSAKGPARYWKFLAFRGDAATQNITKVVTLLSTPDGKLSPDDKTTKDILLEGYGSIRRFPFEPHHVAATRTTAYQYHVVMKYLDNLIAWGDSLFRADTAEAVTEATQRYLLASNILGPRPQPLPAQGDRPARSFLQLRDQLQVIGNVLVELESQFPFNLAPAPRSPAPGGSQASHDWIARAPYFCVPRNQRMLAYWDRVADRLFKVRNCMNLDGVVRQLALFEPAIDPGLLVKAAAAGLDTGAVAAGAANPAGPVRGGTLLQLARGLCDEVRALGNALLTALEKQDAEAITLLRQGQELKIHQRAQDVRYLAWRQAQAATDALVRSRQISLERYHYYLRMLGLDPGTASSDHMVVPRPARPDDQPKLTSEKEFDDAYGQLVAQFDRPLPLQLYPQLKLAGGNSPTISAGTSSPGRLNLTVNEDKELNEHLPAARDLNLVSSILDTVASVVTMIPDIDVDLHFWGLGLHSKVFGGVKLSEVSKIAAGIIRTKATWEQEQAGMAARTASYERRADDWMLQSNLAAQELMHLGRQILGSVIAEQAAHREYLNTRAQIADVSEINTLIKGKYTGQELYGWMQGELTRIYFDYYRFALDVARKAELTLKRELMQPEFDAVQFVRGDYWTTGRKGLLAADSLALDLRRLEVAHHENHRREFELTRHVSVNQLDPLALVRLRQTGTCEITIPESLFDLDCPGHYLRRLRRVSVSIPAVTGPYTSVNCTLSLLRSSVRTVATGADYPRHEDTDERFRDYSGTIQAIVTSTAQDDDGMFANSSPDDRPLPFEGAGAISTWRLELPSEFRQFDYDTIADVVLNLRYTAREGGQVLRHQATGHLRQLIEQVEDGCAARLFAMRLEFPSEWARFAADAGDRPRLAVTLRKEHYPYWSAGRALETTSVMLLARGPADTDAIKVFAGPEESAPSDTLSRDDALGGLFTGRLVNITPPPAVGETVLHFDPGAVTDLWMILTWKGKST